MFPLVMESLLIMCLVLKKAVKGSLVGRYSLCIQAHVQDDKVRYI